MDTKKVGEEEVLYRGITTNPTMWKSSENRPSSAAFKQTHSLSVDREGGRSFVEIKENLIKNISSNLKAVAYFSAKDCFYNHMTVRPDPVINNPYHALIDDEGGVGVGKISARYLAKVCKFSVLSET